MLKRELLPYRFLLLPGLTAPAFAAAVFAGNRCVRRVRDARLWFSGGRAMRSYPARSPRSSADGMQNAPMRRRW